MIIKISESGDTVVLSLCTSISRPSCTYKFLYQFRANTSNKYPERDSVPCVSFA